MQIKGVGGAANRRTLNSVARRAGNPKKNDDGLFLGKEKLIVLMASNYKELSESTLEVEEENDMLLYMWQKAAFIDSGQGVPREMADSLRLRIAQLSSYHTKM